MLEQEAMCIHISEHADGERVNVSQLDTILKHWYEHKDNFLFKLFNDNPYPKSDLQNKKVFNIPFIIEINKIEEYEKDDIIYVYDKESYDDEKYIVSGLKK